MIVRDGIIRDQARSNIEWISDFSKDSYWRELSLHSKLICTQECSQLSKNSRAKSFFRFLDAHRCERKQTIVDNFALASSCARPCTKCGKSSIIIHQTHYEKSDRSRAFNQFTMACELDMINAISAADIAFIMSSSTSAWLLSPLEFSPQKQNGWTLRCCFWGWIMWKMYNKTIIEFGFRMISWIIKTSRLCYLPQPSASDDNTDLGFDNSWYHAQPHPIIV